MKAMQVMSALAQNTRLEVFRKLVAKLPEGMSSGELASATGAAANTMSAHLAILARADLVASDKIGRTVIYRARTAPVEQLSAFLTRTCEHG